VDSSCDAPCSGSNDHNLRVPSALALSTFPSFTSSASTLASCPLPSILNATPLSRSCSTLQTLTRPSIPPDTTNPSSSASSPVHLTHLTARNTQSSAAPFPTTFPLQSHSLTTPSYPPVTTPVWLTPTPPIQSSWLHRPAHFGGNTLRTYSISRTCSLDTPCDAICSSSEEGKYTPSTRNEYGIGWAFSSKWFRICERP